jgi:hypothetical protein
MMALIESGNAFNRNIQTLIGKVKKNLTFGKILISSEANKPLGL